MEEGGGHRGLRGTPDVWRWALTFRPAQTPGMLPSPSRQDRGFLPAQPLPPGARPGLRPTSGGRGTETRGAEALRQRSPAGLPPPRARDEEPPQGPGAPPGEGAACRGKDTSGSRSKSGVWFHGARLTQKPRGAGLGAPGQAGPLQHAPPGVPSPSLRRVLVGTQKLSKAPTRTRLGGGGLPCHGGPRLGHPARTPTGREPAWEPPSPTCQPHLPASCRPEIRGPSGGVPSHTGAAVKPRLPEAEGGGRRL